MLAKKVWKVLLDCDTTGADNLARIKEKRRKEHKKAKKQKKEGAPTKGHMGWVGLGKQRQR